MEATVSSDRLERKDSGRDRKKSQLRHVQNYVLGDVLGEGSYGQVREGLWVGMDDEKEKSHKLKFGHRVAVKIIGRRLLRKVFLLCCSSFFFEDVGDTLVFAQGPQRARESQARDHLFEKAEASKCDPTLRHH